MIKPFSTGVSRKPNTDEAVEEALNQALTGIDGKPSLIIAYASPTTHGRPEKLLDSLKSRVQGSEVVAVSTAGEYFNSESLSRSLVVAAFSSKYFKASVGVAEGAQTDPYNAGVNAAKSALSKLSSEGVTVRFKPPAVALLHSAPGAEEEVLRGVREVLGRYTPLIGGSSGDDFRLSPPYGYQVGGGTAGSGLAVLTLIITRLDYEVVGGHACRPTGKYGVVSKVSGPRGNIIDEVDGVKAIEKYAEWVGLSVNDVRDRILEIGLSKPLAVRNPVTGHYYVKHPAAVVNDGIACFASIPEKHVVHLMMHDLRESKALGWRLGDRIKGRLGRVAGALLIHCAGSAAYLGSNGRSEFISGLWKSLGEVPVAGLAAYGEQWEHDLMGTSAAHNNLTTAVLAFSLNIIS